MKFEDIEHYMHEEHLQNEAAKFTADLMHSQEARRALHHARLQRAVAACFLLGVITLTSSAFMPVPRYDYAYGTHAEAASSVCDSVQQIYSML